MTMSPFDPRLTDHHKANVERRTQERIARLRDDEQKVDRGRIFGNDPNSFEQIAMRYPVLKEKVL